MLTFFDGIIVMLMALTIFFGGLSVGVFFGVILAEKEKE